MRVVDVVTIRVAPEGLVLGGENAGHAGRRRDGVDDGRAVPAVLAHRIERGQ